MILLVVAMNDEAKDICVKLNQVNQAPFVIYEGKLAGKDVALIISGIGKSNAAAATVYGLLKYPVTSLIINLGIAGGYHVKVHETYVVNQATYNDVDVTAFNYDFGQVPKFPTHFLTSQYILSKLDFIKQEKLYSMDSFSTKVMFNNAYLADMEATAVYQIAYLFQKQVLSLKVVSDLIGETDQIKAYKTSKESLSVVLYKGLIKVLEVL